MNCLTIFLVLGGWFSRNVSSLPGFLPYNLPASDRGVALLNVAKNHASAFKTIRPDLPRSNISGVGGHFWQMHNPLLPHVDDVPATISESTLSGGRFFLQRAMRRVGPLGQVGIHKLTTHITVTLVYEEALGVRPEKRKGASGAVLHSLFGRHELPRAQDLLTNLRLRLAKSRAGAHSEYDQKQCRKLHRALPRRQ